MQCYKESHNVTKPITEHHHNATWRWMNGVVQFNITIMQHDRGLLSQSSLTTIKNCNPT